MCLYCYPNWRCCFLRVELLMKECNTFNLDIQCKMNKESKLGMEVWNYYYKVVKNDSKGKCLWELSGTLNIQIFSMTYNNFNFQEESLIPLMIVLIDNIKVLKEWEVKERRPRSKDGQRSYWSVSVFRPAVFRTDWTGPQSFFFCGAIRVVSGPMYCRSSYRSSY